MKKICLVVQRYGDEINGGAELLTKQLAEKLVPFYNVDVLTTKAKDYITWRNEYTEDHEVINGVNVYRFPSERESVHSDFMMINNRFLQRYLKREEEEQWLYEQGPVVPKLVDYLKAHEKEYYAILVFTYLFYPSVKSVSIAPHKTIMFPFAHDEPYIKMSIFNDIFYKPRAFVFETDEERLFIRHRYNNYEIPYKLGGAGVDVPKVVDGDEFKKKYNLDEYIIYVGRVDEGKNCKELFQFFKEYKEKYPSNVKLVLLGKAVIDIPQTDDIISLGFVSDEDKFNGIKGAKCLVLPSRNESLSIVVLEALTLGIPVLVNGNCAVLDGHIKRSSAGYSYFEKEDFLRKLNSLLEDNKLREEMGIKGKKYVRDNYDWDVIISKLNYLIEYVGDERK